MRGARVTRGSSMRAILGMAVLLSAFCANASNEAFCTTLTKFDRSIVGRADQASQREAAVNAIVAYANPMILLATTKDYAYEFYFEGPNGERHVREFAERFFPICAENPAFSEGQAMQASGEATNELVSGGIEL